MDNWDLLSGIPTVQLVNLDPDNFPNEGELRADLQYVFGYTPYPKQKESEYCSQEAPSYELWGQIGRPPFYGGHSDVLLRPPPQVEIEGNKLLPVPRQKNPDPPKPPKTLTQHVNAKVKYTEDGVEHTITIRVTCTNCLRCGKVPNHPSLQDGVPLPTEFLVPLNTLIVVFNEYFLRHGNWVERKGTFFNGYDFERPILMVHEIVPDAPSHRVHPERCEPPTKRPRH